jgi:protein-tyrosine phosphatase
VTTTALRSVPNFRPIGGLPTLDGGLVRGDVLYRSGTLGELGPDDMAALRGLRLRTVYDLRSDWERAAEPDQLPNGVRHVVADVTVGMGDDGPAQLRGLMADASAAADLLGNGRATAMWLEQYRSFVRLDGARQAFGLVLRDLAAADGRPALVHCATGKDRTGWLAAVLLWLFRVPDDLVMRDYLASNRRLRPFLAPALARWEERGGDPRLLRPIVAARRSYLETARTELVRCFGSVERYLSEGMGVDSATQDRLRAALVEQ